MPQIMTVISCPSPTLWSPNYHCLTWQWARNAADYVTSPFDVAWGRGGREKLHVHDAKNVRLCMQMSEDNSRIYRMWAQWPRNVGSRRRPITIIMMFDCDGVTPMPRSPSPRSRSLSVGEYRIVIRLNESCLRTALQNVGRLWTALQNINYP